MECSSSVAGLLSPESTVTSLLSSSGHLRSSLLPPEHNTPVRYRDQDYDSASAALDAYIEDFDRSRHHVGSLTGTLVLPHKQTSASSQDRVGSLRNKDVLRERLTDWELDYLNLPVSTHPHPDGASRLSMTTDELLSIPHDGSMPVTCTSAFIQGLLSKSRASQPFPFSTGLASSAWPGLGSDRAKPTHLSQDHYRPLPTRIRRTHSCGGRPKTATVKPAVDNSSFVHRAVRSKWAQPSASLHLPHWLTSNKADMDCSEVSSVPDLSYPAWVQHCDLHEAPPRPVPEPWGDHGYIQMCPRTLHNCFKTKTHRHITTHRQPKKDVSRMAMLLFDSQQMLQDVRLQLAEQISLLATEGKGSNILKTVFSDNRIETLIQKADEVLDSLSQSRGRAERSADPDVNCAAVSLAGTEERVRSESQDPPSTRGSATGGFAEASADGEVEVCGRHENGIWKQPGPVEALKQMLFRLQAVEAELEKQLKKTSRSTSP
ncbi:lung adenoma susceptibility protein 2 [Xenentodon cancila]